MNIFDMLDSAIEHGSPKVPINQASTAIKKTVKAEALRLYLEGVPNSKIAIKLGINRSSVIEWAAKGGWKIKRDKLNENTQQSVIDNVRATKERIAKVFKGVQAYGIKAIQQGDIKVTAGDVIRAAEAEARLTMPETYQNSEFPDVVELLRQAKEEKKDAK